MVKISANLGFLWTDRPLPDRLRAAAAAGFSAVEVHFPYEHPAAEIADLLDELGLTMVGLNTALGANGQADLGVAARPGREDEAAAIIDQAITYAATVKAGYVSVVAGRTAEEAAGHDACEAVFRRNLALACEQASAHGITIVMEPLSVQAAPGFHLSRLEQALETIEAVGADNLGVMLDCFHTQVTQGNVVTWMRECLPVLGHVQIASVPDRSEPDDGELAYDYILGALDEMGYERFVGAEYTPATTVEAGLGWFDRYRA